jgi:arylsulfatase A-like enzyme
MKNMWIGLALLGTAYAEKPNFVFILVDDMSWTGLSAQMDDREPESKSDFYQTPNIDGLASQGMRFSNAYAPASMCTPSRAAILTGKTPAELHMTTPGGGRAQSYQKLAAPDFIKEFPTSETTVAEALNKQGYSTAHFGKWHLGEVSPSKHGFDVSDGPTGNDPTGFDAATDPKDVFGVTERAVEFMTKQAKAGTPFYLQVSHYAVHIPFQCLEKSKEKFSKVRKGTRHTDIEYAAMTWDLDTAVGTLLEQIDQLGLAENTYVVFMSDNGGPGNARQSQNLPLAGGKGTLYEGGIRVPLIVRGPGIQADSFCHENVTGCDLFPTFSEWAGVSVSGKIEGVSLVPLLTGNGNFQRLEESLLFHFPHYGQGPSQKPQSALILGNDKIVKDLETGAVQLFDLEKDLSEKNDLAGKLPEKAQKLDALLTRRLEELGAQMPTENPNYDPSASRPSVGRRRS